MADKFEVVGRIVVARWAELEAGLTSPPADVGPAASLDERS